LKHFPYAQVEDKGRRHGSSPRGVRTRKGRIVVSRDLLVTDILVPQNPVQYVHRRVKTSCINHCMMNLLRYSLLLADADSSLQVVELNLEGCL
jgi:hypothetical protein